jgi:hypothetical protein
MDRHRTDRFGEMIRTRFRGGITTAFETALAIADSNSFWAASSGLWIIVE